MPSCITSNVTFRKNLKVFSTADCLTQKSLTIIIDFEKRGVIWFKFKFASHSRKYR